MALQGFDNIAKYDVVEVDASVFAKTNDLQHFGIRMEPHLIHNPFMKAILSYLLASKNIENPYLSTMCASGHKLTNWMYAHVKCIEIRTSPELYNFISLCIYNSEHKSVCESYQKLFLGRQSEVTDLFLPMR